MTPVAITVAQPRSSLLAHGIAEWHTSRTQPRLEPGQEVWVHAGREALTEITEVGDFEVWPADPPGQLHPNHDTERPLRLYPNKGRFLSLGTWLPLPLGAVLSRHRLAEVVPIVRTEVAGRDQRAVHVCVDRIYMAETVGYMLPLDNCADISDQLPYSDWSPGRWAWRLELIERLEVAVAEYPMACDDCADWGCPNPHARAHLQDGSRRVLVPVRGRPGIWRPDPALIAAVRGEG